MNKSLKAQIVLKIFEELAATNEENKINIYQILDKLENTDLQDWFPEETAHELFLNKSEMTQKSVSTTIAALVRAGQMRKTEAVATVVNNKTRNIRSYYTI
jgi:DNA-binding transcriptional ArsR family regulator